MLLVGAVGVSVGLLSVGAVVGGIVVGLLAVGVVAVAVPVVTGVAVAVAVVVAVDDGVAVVADGVGGVHWASSNLALAVRSLPLNVPLALTRRVVSVIVKPPNRTRTSYEPGASVVPTRRSAGVYAVDPPRDPSNVAARSSTFTAPSRTSMVIVATATLYSLLQSYESATDISTVPVGAVVLVAVGVGVVMTSVAVGVTGAVVGDGVSVSVAAALAVVAVSVGSISSANWRGAGACVEAAHAT